MPLRLDGRGRTARAEGGRRGGDTRNERGAKGENRAFSVFWLERNPRGKEEREVRG